MAVKSLLGFGFLLTCCLLEVSSRPNNELMEIQLPIDEPQEQNPDKVGRSVTFTKDPPRDVYNPNTREIIEKIQAINDGLKKPHRQQINFNKPPQPQGSYVIDRKMLEKIQQIIAADKIKPLSEAKQYEDNYLNEDSNDFRREHSRALQSISNTYNQQSTPLSPFPYIMNIPVLVMPSQNNMRYANNDLNSIQSTNFQSRQEQPSPFPFLPSFSNFQWPSQFQWPFANVFPLLIKDPFIGWQQGGGWNNFIEYGQNADVCARKQKSMNLDTEVSEATDKDDEINRILRVIASSQENIPNENNHEEETEESIDPVNYVNSRQARALKKRTITNNAPVQEIENSRKAQKNYTPKPVTRNPSKKVYTDEELQSIKNAADDDLRFSGFDWFGNKKPVAPSPGFFINRLRVRKGGVAIAGPGGVATAGKGGTAIVGPGGLAYTQPGGLAVAGPDARVIALSSATDLNSVVSRLRDLNDSSMPLQQPISEGTEVAKGPIIYYHPTEQT
ncbi:uncharacterized protein [Epargyreus clarus]|uniref:uncharacterized protein isoform X1 n=1 Tax=Epargyreus clarus TaxID=520877 RepID=UPI003C2F88FE